MDRENSIVRVKPQGLAGDTPRGDLSPDAALTPEVLPAAGRDPLALYLARLAKGSSRESMGRALDQLARQLSGREEVTAAAFPWARLRYPEVVRLRSYLADHYAPRTANKLLSAIRGVMDEARKARLIDGEEWALIRDLEGVKGSRIPKGRALSSAEVDRLLAAARGMPQGARARALVILLYATGLRRFEAAGLTLADVDPGGKAVTVIGKRNKQRRVPLGPEAVEALAQWLDVRGREPGPLFPASAPNGTLLKRAMSPHSIYTVLRRLGAAAGVKFASHDFRRTVAGDLLDQGVDLVTVQRLLGHANPQTTAQYDRRDERAMDAAVEKRKLNLSSETAGEQDDRAG